MSSRKAATAKTSVRRSAAAQSAAKPAAKAEPRAEPKSGNQAAAKGGGNGTAAAAKELAARIERELREGRLDALTPEAFQALMAALCKSYAAKLEAGDVFPALAARESVSPTELMTTTSALLKAANLAVFELGMWQSWTGR
jgi:hypothetical protein